MSIRVGIAGAGFAGVGTAKVLQEKLGADVTIFEAGRDSGGVWSEDRIYEQATTQTPGRRYRFSDFMSPGYEAPGWHNAAKVRAYLQAYADTHQLTARIHFDSPVLSINPGVQGKTRVRFLHGKQINEKELDLMVVATGVFNRPKFPAHIRPYLNRPGLPETLHTSQLTNLAQFKGKRVVVVGWGRSATEPATFLANKPECLADKVHLVYRDVHWKVPRYFQLPFGSVNMEEVLFSRMSEALFVPDDAGFFRRLIDKTLVAGLWKLMEATLIKQFHLKELGMIPAAPMHTEVDCTLGLEPENFYDSLLADRIQAYHGEIEKLEPGYAVLKDGTRLAADVVIFGTGFEQTQLPFFTPDLNQRLVDSSNGMYRLYRNMVPLDIPGLRFAGFNSGFYSPLAFEVGAHWMAAELAGTIRASRAEMEAAISTDHRRRLARPVSTKSSGTCHAPTDRRGNIDILMSELGHPGWVQGNPLKEFFGPVAPEAYAQYLYK